MNEHKSGINPGFLAKHTLRLTGLNQSNAALISDALEEMPCMDSIKLSIPKQTVKLAYDASRHDIDEMIAIINQYGVSLNTGWWSRTKLSWQRQIDQNIQDNSKHEAHCCNKLPPRK